MYQCPAISSSLKSNLLKMVSDSTIQIDFKKRLTRANHFKQQNSWKNPQKKHILGEKHWDGQISKVLFFSAWHHAKIQNFITNKNGSYIRKPNV